MTTQPVTPTRPSFVARSRKALSAGIAGGVTTAGAAILSVSADGTISGSDGWIIAGAFVGGFLPAAVAAWFTTNAEDPNAGE